MKYKIIIKVTKHLELLCVMMGYSPGSISHTSVPHSHPQILSFRLPQTTIADTTVTCTAPPTPSEVLATVGDAVEDVQELNLANVGLLPEHISDLSELIAALPSLKKLDISGNTGLATTTEACKALAEMFTAHKFRAVNATNIGIQTIPDGDIVLTSLAKVVGLQIHHNLPRPEVPAAAVDLWTSVRAQVESGADMSADDAELAELLNGSTIYEAIGGHDALEAVVNSFYVLMSTDERVIRHFRSVTFGAMRRKQLAFLTQVMGGPAEYTGKEMGPAHAHLDINDAEYDATTTNLVSAILHHIPAPPVPITRKLLQLTEGMRADIIKA